ncbi:DUF1904 domain-containing protein [Shewanella waksmanii]|uniref:DUF1904 domain-containing protein n=1 Tax=Shewanella waksmanii TaxID=213783 RepID=UPI00048A502A|nr:DUF1904 domain-containing protein [Shewanella waksmanii]
MPHIRMRGLPEHIVAQLSQTLLKDLASVTQIKPDAFTLDWVPSISYRGGNIDISVVQVEVLWFPKAPEIQDEVERTIRKQLLTVYSQATHIAILFTALEPRGYYRNGTHF